MPYMKWSKLSPLQLGRYAEYYAKMEFTSYGFDVYTSEVDDHGVDFIAKDKQGSYFEVQVKSVRNNNYQFLRKDHTVISDKFLVCYIRFEDDHLPYVYVFPTTVWNEPNSLFVDKDYDKPGLKSKPEYGINYNRKTSKLMEPYKAENFFHDAI